MLLREFLRMSQYRTVLCYLLLSIWIFLIIVGMQRYITGGNWMHQTNVNLNARIYLRNEINVLPVKDHMPRIEQEPVNAKELSREERICSAGAETAEGHEGGGISGFKLQGIIVVTRHGDRGPMVHVRDADSVDCGPVPKDNPQLDNYRTFLSNNTQNSTLNHMTWLKMGSSFHGFPLFPLLPRCQLAQLTQKGIAQHLRIGSQLRTAYGRQLGLLQEEERPPGSNPTQSDGSGIVVYSTRYRRTFQSAMALLYGLLPVEKWLALNIRDSHSLTFCFADCACPKGDKLKGEMNVVLEKENKQVKHLVKFMEERLLQSPGNNYHALGIRDALLTFLCHRTRIPCEKEQSKKTDVGGGVVASDLNDVINIDQEPITGQKSVVDEAEDKSAAVDDENDDGNGDIISAFTDNGNCIRDEHVDQLMEFTQGLLMRMREQQEMRLISLLRAYGFMRNIVNYMLKMISGSHIKMVLYSGHDLSIQYLLSALGLNGRQFVDIPYATRMIFEVYKSENDAGQFYFRTIYNQRDVTRSVVVCEGGKSVGVEKRRKGNLETVHLCPIENIIRYVHDDYFASLNATNFRDACSTRF